ncbi:MAG TPA: cation:proton antiporter [Vicinamibacterales bacterium]|jgi:Kef-type K+ transport system membrane component KefB|nr:cation:proton antiporter [Vicinamibacterales bacterium]
MARAAALLVALVLAWLLGQTAAPEAAFRSTALAIGVALVAAALVGRIAERIGLPRVTGYLVFGLLCGPSIANIITRPMARELQIVNGLAVTLIAFVAGLEMNLRRLAPRLTVIARVGGVTILLTYLMIFVAVWTAWPWLRIAPGFTGIHRLAASALLTALVASFSPTVSIAIVAEARAAGPFTELTLAIVILADLVLILAFTLIMQFVRVTFGTAAHVSLFAGVTWEIFGSFAFGALAGGVLALYLAHIGREVAIVVLGFCVVIAGVAEHFQLEPLMAALAAGLVVENLAPSAGDVVKEGVERSALPVLVVFFAAAGASLQLDALATLGWIALGVAAARTGAIWISARLGRAAAGLSDEVTAMTWMALVSQAGVTLGLTLIVAAEFPGWGTTIETLMLALIALHQLIGPVLYRAALARAGEIGRQAGTPTALMMPQSPSGAAR